MQAPDASKAAPEDGLRLLHNSGSRSMTAKGEAGLVTESTGVAD
jgi:hypothetical protein